ncbi:unnamed protein product [Echinostoma caproni]|uniref:V-type proton ATPase subunit G n=1 Tax=Echinostoma caproni TaxID=27848 RepID=A0A183AXZ3_9TREM|nr:unnamed protein product [Echinostoma caproni]
MAARNDGIQLLLQAEKSASEKVLGRRSEIQAQIEKLTDDIIKTQSSSVNMHKEDAINLLLGLVMEIEPRLHPNYRVGATV